MRVQRVEFCRSSPLYIPMPKDDQPDSSQSRHPASSPSATMSSIHDSERRIVNDGFYYEQDSLVGKQVDALFLAHGYYFKNVGGLRFCKARAFDDEVRRDLYGHRLFPS